jgi:small-conductance mechanosensitive channel
MRSWENKRLIIPNEKLDSLSIVNYSIVDTKMLLRVELGISYDTNIDLAKDVLLQLLSQCPYRDVDADDPYVRVIGHLDFAIQLRCYMWVKDMDDYWAGRFWLLEHSKKTFDKHGIEIPFPYRTIVYKKDLPARQVHSTAVAPREDGAPE